MFVRRNFPRDQGEADKFIVPWVLLLFFLEEMRDTCFLLVLRNFTQSPWPFKDRYKWSYNDIGQIPQHFWVYPIHWTSVRPVYLYVLWLVPPLQMVNFHYFKLPQRSQELWFLRANLSSKKQGKEDIEYFGLFLLLGHQLSCPIQQQTHVFHSLHFDTDVLAFLTALLIPWHETRPSVWPRHCSVHTYPVMEYCTASDLSLSHLFFLSPSLNLIHETTLTHFWYFLLLPYLSTSQLFPKTS